MISCEQLLKMADKSIGLTMPDDQRQWCVVVVVVVEWLLYGTGQRGCDKRAAGEQQLQLLRDCHYSPQSFNDFRLIWEMKLTPLN